MIIHVYMTRKVFIEYGCSHKIKPDSELTIGPKCDLGLKIRGIKILDAQVHMVKRIQLSITRLYHVSFFELTMTQTFGYGHRDKGKFI